MSTHDEIRLQRGQAALTKWPVEDMSDAELKSESESIGRALAGIQSTDDPSEAYSETEGALIDRIRVVDKEIERRKSK